MDKWITSIRYVTSSGISGNSMERKTVSEKDSEDQLLLLEQERNVTDAVSQWQNQHYVQNILFNGHKVIFN